MSNRAIIEKEITQGVVPIGTPKAYKYDASLVESAVATVLQGMTALNNKTNEEKDELDEFTNEKKTELQGYLSDAQTILGAIKNEYGYPFTASTASAMTDTKKIYVYVGDEDGYTNGNWYYYNGTAWVSGGVYNSTAFETDKSLSVADMAADAEVVGTFKEQGRNHFDNAQVMIGKNATGASTSTRAIGNALPVLPNGLALKVYNLPSNLKYSIESYSTMDLSSRQAGWDNWSTSTEAFTTAKTYQYPYVRFLFASVDNNALTEADFEGLQIMVNDGYVIYPYEPYFTAVDRPARRQIDEIQNSEMIQEARGLFPYGGWEQGTLDNSGAEADSAYRIRSDYIEVEPYSVLQYVYKPPFKGYIAAMEYDENKILIRFNGYGYNIFGLSKNTKYIRILAKSSPTEVVITPAFARELNISIVVNGKAEEDFLNVMTYNIGHYDYGVAPVGIPDELYDEKLINYRRFFAEQNCDIVGIQEFDTWLSQDGTHLANDEIFNKLYPYAWDTGTWESLKSRYSLVERDTKQLSTGRYYVEAYTSVNGKNVYLLNVHLSPGYDATAAQTRVTEANEVIDILADKERFILFGDFNPEPNEEDSLFGLFSAEGYNLANCGWFGKYLTWSNNRADLDTDDPPTGTRLYYIDNIITSANISIEEVERLTVYSKLSSDHIPIRARLKIT